MLSVGIPWTILSMNEREREFGLWCLAHSLSVDLLNLLDSLLFILLLLCALCMLVQAINFDHRLAVIIISIATMYALYIALATFTMCLHFKKATSPNPYYYKYSRFKVGQMENSGNFENAFVSVFRADFKMKRAQTISALAI